MSSTRRQQIAEFLRHGGLTAPEIAGRIEAPVKSVLADLEHVRRGVKGGEKWVVRDAECLACGFVFKGRDRLNVPSRCPECRSEQIRDGAFEIRAS